MGLPLDTDIEEVARRMGTSDWLIKSGSEIKKKGFLTWLAEFEKMDPEWTLAMYSADVYAHNEGVIKIVEDCGVIDLICSLIFHRHYSILVI